MKKNPIHTTCILALVGMMAAGLWGCQKDDLAEQGGNAPQTELQLTVIDGGYTAHQALNYEDGTLHELPQTRATENGYKTIFAAGDQIGLYAVKGSSLVATNLRLTLTDVSGTLKWQPDAGMKLPADANRYFAYYPYQSSLNGTLDNSATTADEFFAKVISAWTPATDQSTAYPSKDLMVGMGTLGATPVNGFYPLTITLAHKMGLAVIKLPSGAKDVIFYTNIPYEDGVTGQYRYLLKPATPTNLSCSFTDGREMRGFVIAATIAGGNYKTYTVSGKPLVSMKFGIDLTSYSSDKTYVLPFKTTGVTGDYDLTVDWGDGSQVTNILAGTDLTTAATTSLLTHTYAKAKAYTITISSPQIDFSKEQIPGFKPGKYRTSNNNKLKLKSLLAPLLNTGEDSFSECFSDCSKLTGSIPTGLFDKNPQVTDFSYCFSGCSKLTVSIPTGLFDKNTEVTNFSYCFKSCTNLTGLIPAGLFDKNPKVTTFRYCFAYCESLNGSIPTGLFDKNPKVTDFSECFRDCKNLTGSIPTGLFDKNELVTEFSACFYGCNRLTGSIPTGLFDKNPLVTDFSSCFMYCNGLTSIPEKLFDKNPLATDFSYCFYSCVRLTMNANIFCDEATGKTTRFSSATKQISFNRCFNLVGSDSSVSNAGTTPALWSYTYDAVGYDSALCFRDIGTVTNAGDILDTWK